MTEAFAWLPLDYQSVRTSAELRIREVEKGRRRRWREVAAGMRERWVSETVLDMTEESEGVSMLESGTAQVH